MSTEQRKTAPAVAERTRYLERCRVLERDLNPHQVPPGCDQREFAWQYRAFRERLDEYGRLIDRLDRLPERSAGDTVHRLMRVERAIHVSLQYFQNAFERNEQPDEEEVDS